MVLVTVGLRSFLPVSFSRVQTRPVRWSAIPVDPPSGQKQDARVRLLWFDLLAVWTLVRWSEVR